MYSSFEKYLDSIDKLDKKAYENIKSKFGEDTDLYFEEYVLSIDENDSSSYDKVDYYIKLKSVKFDASNISNKLDPNVSTYLNQISKYPVLEQCQERELMIKIRKIEDELKKDSVDEKSLDAIMSKYGYNKQIGHNLESRKLQLKYLCKNETIIDRDDLNIFKKYVEYMKTKEYFYNCNLRLVVFFAKIRVCNESILLDSIQNGNIGLIKAIDNYDISKGTKFSTYAYYWINNYMVREYSYNKCVLKVPYNMLETINSYKVFKDAFYSNNGMYPAYDDIYEFFYKKMKTKEYFYKKNEIEKKNFIDQLIKQVEMTIYREHVTSLNATIDYDDGDETELMDYLTDNSIDIEDSLNKSIIEEKLKNVFNKLSNKIVCVLLLRNGIKISKYLTFEETKKVFSNLSDDKIFSLWNKSHHLTQKEIGDLLSLTHQRVSDIEVSGKRKMKKYGKKFVGYIK